MYCRCPCIKISVQCIKVSSMYPCFQLSSNIQSIQVSSRYPCIQISSSTMYSGIFQVYLDQGIFKCTVSRCRSDIHPLIQVSSSPLHPSSSVYTDIFQCTIFRYILHTLVSCYLPGIFQASSRYFPGIFQVSSRYFPGIFQCSVPAKPLASPIPSRYLMAQQC